MKKTILITILTLVFLMSCELIIEDKSKPEIQLMTISLDYNYTKDSDLGLKGTLNDAKEFKKVICEICDRLEINCSPKECYQDSNAEYTDPNKKPVYPSKYNVLAELEQMKDNSEDYSINIIYFSGHGSATDGSWFLARPIENGSYSNNTPTSELLLSPEELYKTFKKETLKGNTLKGKTLIISDSCFSGFLYRDNPYSLKGENFTFADAFNKLFNSNPSLENENIFILTSVNHDKQAYEQHKSEVNTNERTHGFFTLALLEGLGWARGRSTVLNDDNIDPNNYPTILKHGAPPASVNGIVSVDSLYSYIVKNQKISIMSSEFQDPQLSGGRKDLVLFRY